MLTSPLIGGFHFVKFVNINRNDININRNDVHEISRSKEKLCEKHKWDRIFTFYLYPAFLLNWEPKQLITSLSPPPPYNNNLVRQRLRHSDPKLSGALLL